eukprot:NODE_4_length_77007_cov_1.156642.p31 type:complete len:311 gc:universal NODE_4_length_77007_cov_1.156642:39219-40151(+)
MRMKRTMDGIEFFSGIGAWNLVFANSQFLSYEINSKANHVFQSNIKSKPIAKNLATIKHLPVAQIWCMSPPCQPFTSQKSSKQLDLSDKRNDAFLHIILNFLGKLRPNYIFIENVSNFKDSQTEKILLQKLRELQYAFDFIILSPTDFGIPNQRNRYFLFATFEKPEFKFEIPPRIELGPISSYLDDPKIVPQECFLTISEIEKYFQIFDIKRPSDKTTNCFTKNYYRMFEGTGSILQTEGFQHLINDENKHYLGLRRFTPTEICKLFGFPTSFKFDLPLKDQYKLLGNSINLVVLKYVYQQAFGTENTP